MARASAPVAPVVPVADVALPEPCVVLLRSALTGEDLGSFQLEQRTMLGETTDGGHGYLFFFMGWISKLVDDDDDVDDDYYYEYESPTEIGMKISKFFLMTIHSFFLHDYE